MNEITWQVAPPSWILNQGEVHVWHLQFDEHDVRVATLWEYLSADEKARAERYHFEKDHVRFVLARGFLRELLGKYLNQVPSELRFEYSEHGKPRVCGDEITFNISHSGQCVLYAFARSCSLGVDVELIKPQENYLALAKRYFHPSEYQALLELPVSEQSTGFFRLWTQKEAVVKALGSGLFQELNHFSVSLDDKGLLAASDVFGPINHWQLRVFQPAENYMAALAVCGVSLRRVEFFTME